MKYLLDVNVLLAAVWESHPHHRRVFDWLEGKPVVLCPLTDSGFLRISTQPSVYNASMLDARRLLALFIIERDARWVACDLPALDAAAKNTAQVTDAYLAALAGKHGLKLATLDEGIKHPAVMRI